MRSRRRPFRAHGLAFSVLGLGVVNAFGGSSGFEGAATLGEESVRSQRTIPAAVAGSLIASAAVYIAFTWIVPTLRHAICLGCRPGAAGASGHRYVGSTMGKLVNVAGVISAFGAQLACINAANRLLFSIGREPGDPRRPARALLVRTSARHGTPLGALVVTGTRSLATLLAFSFEPSPIRALTFIIQYSAYLILVVYLLTVIAALVLVWRRGRRPIPRVIRTLGVLVLGYVLRDAFSPLPAGPFRAAALAALASIVLGIVLTLIPSVHGRLRSSALLNAARVRSPRVG